MRIGKQHLDLAMYGKALVELVKHPSILLLPFIAAIIDVTVSSTSQTVTDPLGGLGAGIFGFFVQLIYGFAFAVAIIQASNIWRGYRGSFDAGWEEARRKAGGILMAVIAFGFILYVAAYIGAAFGVLALVLQAIAAIFLIYTIPAASIGGLPGPMAISGSIRAVRAQPLNAILLGVVFIALRSFAVPQVLIALSNAHAFDAIGVIGFHLVNAILTAIVYAYLAFPFAKAYDDAAFRNLY